MIDSGPEHADFLHTFTVTHTVVELLSPSVFHHFVQLWSLMFTTVTFTFNKGLVTTTQENNTRRSSEGTILIYSFNIMLPYFLIATKQEWCLISQMSGTNLFILAIIALLVPSVYYLDFCPVALAVFRNQHMRGRIDGIETMTNAVCQQYFLKPCQMLLEWSFQLSKNIIAL
ncbi:hypothetical protein ACJX0J_031039 [Zea mays]